MMLLYVYQQMLYKVLGNYPHPLGFQAWGSELLGIKVTEKYKLFLELLEITQHLHGLA